ncbi:MAG: MGMT family protein [Candidatus Omnitrophica bacterium]|jgi:O-6-methylguanine DNA methyltransferase|nr:MGMT family protein [Candidatus Omnitrophota bacterium]
MDNLQKIIFNEVKKLPFGSTLSYKNLAEKLNIRRKERLVGKILSQNKYLIAIPCHRIIKNNGKTGNYKLGAEFKKYLLDWEKRIIS